MGATQDLDQPDFGSATAGLWDNRSNYDASGNVYPSTGGSGASGAILKSDQWRISVAGTLGGTAVSVGDVLVALVDSPGSTSSNWMVLQGNVVAFTGDSGSGGTEGLVPAPAAGDAAANKFLKADGQWVAVSAANLGSANLTSADDARTFTLKTGTTTTQNFQIKNSAGKVGYYFDGANSIAFRTTSFNSTYGGSFTNFNIGESANPVAMAIHLDSVGNSQYYAYRHFAASNVLMNVDARGIYQWLSQTSNSNVDIQYNLYGNTERIVTTAYNLNVWTKHYAAYAEGSINALIDSMGSNTSPQGGRIILSNGSGTAKLVLSANRTHGAAEPTWLGEGAQVGGTRGSINASALLDLQSTTQGLGLPSMTTAQKNAISSPRAGLLVFDDDLNQISYYTGAAWVNL